MKKVICGLTLLVSLSSQAEWFYNCRADLKDKGYSSRHFKHCKGVDNFCAKTLLNYGLAPRDLQYCVGDLERNCVLDIVTGGQAAQNLTKCKENYK